MRARLGHSVFLFLIAAAMMGTLRTTPARASEAPSEWWQQKMNQDFASRVAVRVDGNFGTVELLGARAEAGGLRAGDIQPLKGSTPPPFAENDPTLLDWNSIERIRVPTRATGFGALLGGLIGTGVAIAVAVAGNDPPGSGSADLRPVAIIAGGAALGAALGTAGHQWHVYYPPPDRGIPLRPVANQGQ